ncbi:MAG: hypothetical protein KGL39_01040 [Patescibacteria group bacterium]|nr:hypothetical protein [Patescibacteria group bacterium]
MAKGLAFAAVVLVVIILIVRSRPYYGYKRGRVFLDQNNAHGAVVGSISTTSPKACKKQCRGTEGCGGVAFNPDKAICYMTAPGDYWGPGSTSDYGWAK